MKNLLRKDYKHLSLDEDFDKFSHKKIKNIARWALENPEFRLGFIKKICALEGSNALSSKSLTKILRQLLRAELLTVEMLKILCKSRNGIEKDVFVLGDLTLNYQPLDMDFVQYITDFARDNDEEDEEDDDDSWIQVAITNLLERAVASKNVEMIEFLCNFEASHFSLEKAIQTVRDETLIDLPDEIESILNKHLHKKEDTQNDIFEINEQVPLPQLDPLIDNPYGNIIQRLKDYRTRAKKNEYAAKARDAGNLVTRAYYNSLAANQGRNMDVAWIFLHRLENNPPENLTRNQFFRTNICNSIHGLKGHKVRSNELNSIFNDAKKIHKARNHEQGILERIFSCFK